MKGNPNCQLYPMRVLKHRQRSWRDGLQLRIVCCIRLRLIESFQWHRHTDNRAAALRHPQIPV
jgi:hypothetical protein